MNHMELARALRADTTVHYNCCQSVLIPFAEELGIDDTQATALGANFGAGMRMGATCGALTGALMVLGGLGYGEAEATALLRQFRQTHGDTNCAVLLKASHDRGEQRKDHCDGLVFEMVEALRHLVGENE